MNDEATQISWKGFVTSYPASIGIAIVVAMCILLLFAISRFDTSHGSLTISLLIVLAYIGTVAFCLLFALPKDETVATVIGGLGTAFGAVVAYWLAKDHTRPPPPPMKPPEDKE